MVVHSLDSWMYTIKQVIIEKSNTKQEKNIYSQTNSKHILYLPPTGKTLKHNIVTLLKIIIIIIIFYPSALVVSFVGNKDYYFT